MTGTTRKTTRSPEFKSHATNRAMPITPKAINGANTTCESGKNRRRMNNATGEVARFRFVNQTKNGPVKTKASTLNQKNQRARRSASIAPTQIRNPAAVAKERKNAASLGKAEPPVYSAAATSRVEP